MDWRKYLKRLLPLGMSITFGAMLVILLGSTLATAYTYHDTSWNDSANTLEDGFNFILAQLPLVIKLSIFAGIIGLGFIGYNKMSSYIK